MKAKWFALIGAIVAEVSGSLSLRGAMDYPGLYVIVVLGFGTAFFLLAQTMRLGMPLGVAYGMWGACGVALTAIMSSVFFNEPITGAMALGILAVICGVVCIEMGSQAGQRKQRRITDHPYPVMPGSPEISS